MSPVSSASGTNSLGATSPRRGCSQRTSASVAVVMPGIERDDRLEVQRQLLALDGESELLLEAMALEHRGPHAGVEDREAALAAGLGYVHGDVGVADQLLRAQVAAVADGDARAHINRHALGPDRHRIREGIHDPARDRDRGGLGVTRLLDHHCELVAAQARRAVLGTQAALQAPGHRHQQLVAGGMPEAVVDRLEVVEVDEHDRDVLFVDERLADRVGEQRAVGQAGERIVVGLMVELLLEDAELEDGLLEAVVLESDARVGGERLEQLQIVVVERADDAETVGEHDRADDPLFAGEGGDHRVGDAAAFEVALQAVVAERQVERGGTAAGGLDQRMHFVGDLGVDGLHQLPVGAGTEQGPKRWVLGRPEQDDLGHLGAEGLDRAGEQALERWRDLSRTGEGPVGFIEELEAAMALPLGHVRAVGGEQRGRGARGVAAGRGHRRL